MWGTLKPILAARVADENRFAGVTHSWGRRTVWHHVSIRHHGPKELTGVVDLTRDKDGHDRARLLNLVPGRSGRVYKTWLDARGEAFKKQVQVATLDPFHRYQNAIDDKLEDATAVLDACHVVALGRARCRRGPPPCPAGDPRAPRTLRRPAVRDPKPLLRCGSERLTDKQWFRLLTTVDADERHEAVWVAWQCAQQVRDVYHQPDPAKGRALAEQIVASFPSCPIAEIARLQLNPAPVEERLLGLLRHRPRPQRRQRGHLRP